MKIKKLEKLQDLLDQDMAWRKKELIDIKLLIHSTQNPTLCRVGIALLSAHFEGFIKQAANYYVFTLPHKILKFRSCIRILQQYIPAKSFYLVQDQIR